MNFQYKSVVAIIVLGLTLGFVVKKIKSNSSYRDKNASHSQENLKSGSVQKNNKTSKIQTVNPGNNQLPSQSGQVQNLAVSRTVASQPLGRSWIGYNQLPASLKSHFSDLKEAKFLLDEKQNVIRVRGGIISLDPLNDNSIDQYLSSFLSIQGFESQGFKQDTSLKSNGPLEDVTYYKQTIDDVPVLNSILRVFSSAKGGGIHEIYNGFAGYKRAVKSENLSLQEVLAIARASYAQSVVESINCDYTVYFIVSEVAHLSRLCQVKINKPQFDHREMVIALEDGNILSDKSVLIAN